MSDLDGLAVQDNEWDPADDGLTQDIAGLLAITAVPLVCLAAWAAVFAAGAGVVKLFRPIVELMWG